MPSDPNNKEISTMEDLEINLNKVPDDFLPHIANTKELNAAFDKLIPVKDEIIIDPSAREGITNGWIQSNKVLPLHFNQQGHLVCYAYLRNKNAVQILQNQIRKRVELRLIEKGKYDQLEQSLLEPNIFKSQELEPLQELSQEEQSAVVKTINNTFLEAVRNDVSDIHFEPYRGKMRIRFRRDGKLEIYRDIEGDSASQTLIARLKVLSKLNIAIKREAQSGEVVFNTAGLSQRFRIEITPGILGEKAVLRVLKGESELLGLDDLGFSPTNYDIWKRLINIPEGLILVTGPTGSGKSLTLASTLKSLNSPDINIMSAENPVEYTMEGIHQVATSPKISFANALKSFLRADPDVVLIGEIRDHETAQIAIEASQTGHRVFSTLHTNSASQSINRLTDMGIETFNLSACINGVLAQRLIRRLCKHCKLKIETPSFLKSQYPNAPEFIYKSKGCEHCSGGYRGRVAIHELLSIDDTLRTMIAKGSTALEIEHYALKRDWNPLQSLRMDAIDKVFNGITSYNQIQNLE